MIDIHTHILPGVDDGAYTMEDSLEMARMAVRSGFHTLVATPHYRYYGHDDRVQILESFERLRDQLEYEQIPLEVVLGTELWLSPDNCPQLTEHMTYPGSPWFLAEFSVDEDPVQMNGLLQHYADRGFLPVVAHAERYFALQHDPMIARDWVNKGWAVQLNRDSLLGRFGKGCYYCADYLLTQGWANCIASDAHWVNERNTDWCDALGQLEERYGYRVLEKCLKHNPRKILQGQKLV